MNEKPSSPRNRHSFRPLLFAPPQGPDALPPTQREPRPKSDSHVRLRLPPPPMLPASVEHLDAQDLLDELCEEQLALSVNLACLEKAIEDAPRDAATSYAVAALEARCRDVTTLRDALAALHQLAIDKRVQRLFVADAALADYARGLYAWAHAVVRALETLAVTLRTRRNIDWAMLRWRIDEAKNFHFDELQPRIRADAASIDAPSRDELEDTIDRLFTAAGILETRLDRKFTSAS